MQADQMMLVDKVSVRQDGIADVLDLAGQLSDNEKEFGSWLMPRRCHISSRGRGGSHGDSLGGSRNPNLGVSLRDDAPDADAWPLAWNPNQHVANPSSLLQTRGSPLAIEGHSHHLSDSSNLLTFNPKAHPNPENPLAAISPSRGI